MQVAAGHPVLHAAFPGLPDQPRDTHHLADEMEDASAAIHEEGVAQHDRGHHPQDNDQAQLEEDGGHGHRLQSQEAEPVARIHGGMDVGIHVQHHHPRQERETQERENLNLTTVRHGHNPWRLQQP